MSQYKKEDVKEKIDNAALKVFSEKGYESATIADISKESNVSVGNIYKYYKGKEAIFYSVVPESFVEELKELIKNKIVMWKEDNKRIENNISMNENLADLILCNRESIIILLKGSNNTKYSFIREEFILSLTGIVKDNYSIKGIGNRDKENEELLLKTIFENLINMISKVMLNAESSKDLPKLLGSIIKYHTFGITGIINDSK